MLNLTWNDKVKVLGGTEADASQLDDFGEMQVEYATGPHKGHKATLYTEKHNCGAYGESIVCECGATWESAMYGCWQQGHQREESGDESLI